MRLRRFIAVTAAGALGLGTMAVAGATAASARPPTYRSAAGVYTQFVQPAGGSAFQDTLILTKAHTFRVTHVAGGGPSGTWSQSPLGRITLTGTYTPPNGSTIDYVMYIWKSVPGLGTAQTPGNITADGSAFGTWYATLNSSSAARPAARGGSWAAVR